MNSEEQIISGNRLIARFMGGVFYKTVANEHCFKIAPNRMPIETTQIFVEGYLKYDKSWEWLMPVIEKIRDVDCVDWIETYSEKKCVEQFSIYTDTDEPNAPKFRVSTERMIESAFDCVVQFITWYNEKNKRTTLTKNI